MMTSASGVVGPFAPSARMRHFRRGAFSAVIWRSSAQGAEHIAFQFEDGRIRDRLSFRKSGDGAVQRDMGIQLVQIEPVGIEDTAIGIADRDDFHAMLGHRLRGDGAHIPIALDHGGAFIHLEAQRIHGTANEESNAPPRGLATTQRAA